MIMYIKKVKGGSYNLGENALVEIFSRFYHLIWRKVELI